MRFPYQRRSCKGESVLMFWWKPYISSPRATKEQKGKSVHIPILRNFWSGDTICNWISVSGNPEEISLPPNFNSPKLEALRWRLGRNAYDGPCELNQSESKVHSKKKGRLKSLCGFPLAFVKIQLGIRARSLLLCGQKLRNRTKYRIRYPRLAACDQLGQSR